MRRGKREAIILGVSFWSETDHSNARTDCGMAYLLGVNFMGRISESDGCGDLPSRYNPITDKPVLEAYKLDL
jgi:hypothetical protein